MRRVAAIVLVLLPAVPAPSSAQPVLEDVTRTTGVEFVHSCGSREKDWITEVNGSGVALFDYDGDGDQDIYFVNGSISDSKPPASGPSPPRPSNVLYRNEGGLRFTDVTQSTGVGDTGWGSSASVADVDNDGHLDLYVTNRGPNVLFRNRGDGTFARVERSGTEAPEWSTSASFADFDRDGLVDLYVANYVEFDPATAKRRGDPACVYKGVPIFCGPGGLTPSRDRLYRNTGDGRFRDVSEDWGISAASPSYGLGTLVVDVRRDGFPDIVVANDTRSNYCFLNMAGRGFQEAGLFLGLAYNDYGVEQAGMGLASGDLRGLGRDDILVTNFEDDTNTLYLAGDKGHYLEGTFPAGLGGASYPYLGWGALLLDVDGDRDLDLFVANGHVAPQADDLRSSIGYRQRNQLFLNDGAGKFTECRDGGSGLSVVESSRGAAHGDLDGDGDPDIVISNIDAAPTLLENRTSVAVWVGFRLRGVRSNRAGIGARVIIEADGHRQERTIQSGMSFASQCELVARFGLGTSQSIDSLRVQWPSGLDESFRPPSTGRITELVEGHGKRRSP